MPASNTRKGNAVIVDLKALISSFAPICTIPWEKDWLAEYLNPSQLGNIPDEPTKVFLPEALSESEYIRYKEVQAEYMSSASVSYDAISNMRTKQVIEERRLELIDAMTTLKSATPAPEIEPASEPVVTVIDEKVGEIVVSETVDIATQSAAKEAIQNLDLLSGVKDSDGDMGSIAKLEGSSAYYERKMFEILCGLPEDTLEGVPPIFIKHFWNEYINPRMNPEQEEEEKVATNGKK